MQASGVFLSRAVLTSLSPSAQAEIQRAIFAPSTNESSAPLSATSAAALASPSVDPGGSADLSPAQARKVVNGLSDRPVKALRFIAEQATPAFSYPAMIATVGPDVYGALRGTLAAITRRVRTVLGDAKADLIWYEEAGEGDHDYTGHVTAMTHDALRKAFGIS